MSAQPPGPRGRYGRQGAARGTLVLLTLLVAVAHLWLVGRVLPTRLGEGATETRPRRIEVAFVRQLEPSAPAPRSNAPALHRPRHRLATLASATAASMPHAQAAESPLETSAAATLAPGAPDMPAAGAPDPTPPMASAEWSAPLPLPAAVVASAPSAFDWPPSTRLRYRLSGNYRGAVEGQAQVEWLRSGTRYQVFMDLGIGPSFAPLISRRVSSEGEITAKGLSPRRYDEETHAILRDTRRLLIVLDPDRVRMPDGRWLPRPAGVQDSASQFVQLTWLFTTQPDLLQSGRSIDVPLALPRQIEPWTYDVLGHELLATPAGPVDAIHVKPRREPRPGGDLTAELWVAPSLQYLPVRILIRQDAETYIDLLIDRLPEQAEQGDPRR